jgi:hypothetical protein
VRRNAKSTSTGGSSHHKSAKDSRLALVYDDSSLQALLGTQWHHGAMPTPQRQKKNTFRTPALEMSLRSDPTAVVSSWK